MSSLSRSLVGEILRDPEALVSLADALAPLLMSPPDPGPPPQPYLTVAEAAELIRAPVSFIYNCRSDGRLTPHKRGSRAVVDRHELEAMIRS